MKRKLQGDNDIGIRILIADDHKVVREGLRLLIEKQPDMEVVAEAEDGRTTVRLAKELMPDVVIIDIAMPELNGIEATRQIVAEAPGVKVVALSMHSDKSFVTEMIKAGASGYLLKDCAFEELACAIRTIVENKTYLSPKISDIVVKDYILFPKAGLSVFSVLTSREKEVLQLLTEGKTTRQIASSLHISLKTVESHRRRIMAKLGIYNLAELTKFAIKEGLISLET